MPQRLLPSFLSSQVRDFAGVRPTPDPLGVKRRSRERLWNVLRPLQAPRLPQPNTPESVSPSAGRGNGSRCSLGLRGERACDHAVVNQVRIDRWLWAARLFKTRSAASDAVLGGRVHLNGERVKPSKVVRARDTVEVTTGTIRRTLAVIGVADRRGPASAAAMMYAETPESLVAREEHAYERRLARPLGADLGARPTKQARRRLDALRRAQRRGRS